jgi:predicted aspartyl protease
MKFDYFKLPLPRGSDFFAKSILRPIIPITILQDNNIIQYAAPIDSGADFCIFDAEIGEYLGIDISSGARESFAGIQETGGATAFLHKVHIKVGGQDYKTSVGFSYDIAKHGYGILGQKGFFDLFVVKFDLLKETIELNDRRK